MLHNPWANQPELQSKIPSFCQKSNLQASKLTSLVQRLSISLKTERKESTCAEGLDFWTLWEKLILQDCNVADSLWSCNFVFLVMGEYRGHSILTVCFPRNIPRRRPQTLVRYKYRLWIPFFSFKKFLQGTWVTLLYDQNHISRGSQKETREDKHGDKKRDESSLPMPQQILKPRPQNMLCLQGNHETQTLWSWFDSMVKPLTIFGILNFWEKNSCEVWQTMKKHQQTHRGWSRGWTEAAIIPNYKSAGISRCTIQLQFTFNLCVSNTKKKNTFVWWWADRNQQETRKNTPFEGHPPAAPVGPLSWLVW